MRAWFKLRHFKKSEVEVAIRTLIAVGVAMISVSGLAEQTGDRSLPKQANTR